MSQVVMLSAHRETDRDRLLHQMAAPFFDIAARLEEGSRTNSNPDDWKALLETNNFIWRATADYLPRNFDQDVPEATSWMLENIAEYMPRAGRAVLKAPDAKICARMITLNRNMYSQILTMRAGA